MSNIQIGSLTDNYFYIDFTGKTDPKDIYSFNIPATGSTRISAEGISGDINMELRDKDGKVIKSIATIGTNAATLSVDNLGAADYTLNVSPVSRDTNYQVSLTPNGKVDPITRMKVDSGFFTPDQKGQVGFDFLYDGGGYKGEVAIFSVDGMENLTPGSKEFIKEAARRALTDSVLGHIVISDYKEGAKPEFRGGLKEDNYNDGQYQGVKTYAMTPGKVFAVMLVPNGKVQDVFNNPDIGGDKHPLFSLSSSNQNSAWLYGEVADVTGDGKAFAMEDKNPGSDKDYNDIVFNLTGATGKAVLLKEVIDPAKDWTTSDKGKKLIDYVKSTLPVPEPLIETKPPVETPSVETKPPVETPSVETKPSVETPPVATTPIEETKPPVETPSVETKPSVETPPVATTPIEETKPPVETTPPVATTPPIETKPPVATTPPVETTPPVVTTPPIETKPPVETTPPVATTPPIETKPPVATTPPVETTLPVETPPVATTPPIEETESPVEPEPIGEPTIDPMPFIGVIDTGFAENNPDLDNSKVTLGRDRVDKDTNPYLSAGEGDQHGTFIRGLISAIQGNDKGIDGINDRSPVYLSRAIGSGEWDLALNDFVSEAKAQKKKNAIANLSLDLTQKNADGTITTRYEFTARERAALENARQNGVLIVVAAGNDGSAMSVLGQSSQEFENIITIGSSDGFGRADYSSYGYGLDLLVPGGTIENPTLSTVGDGVGTMVGTSVAAAKATGMVSVVWAANPDLNATQVIDVLTGSAIDLKEPGWDEETGFGVVNFKGAIDLAKETTPQSYVPTAFLNPTTWGKEGLVTPMERAAEVFEHNGKWYDWEQHTVQDGENLSVIAESRTSDANDWSLIANNPNNQFASGDPNLIYPGEIYWVPKEVSAPQQQPPANDNPNVDLNPDNNPNVDLNPDNNPNVDLNPDNNPNVDLNPPLSNSINLNGYTIDGKFYQEFLNTGGLNGWLGVPTSEEKRLGDGNIIQYFEHGHIYLKGSNAFAYKEGNGLPSQSVPNTKPKPEQSDDDIINQIIQEADLQLRQQGYSSLGLNKNDDATGSDQVTTSLESVISHLMYLRDTNHEKELGLSHNPGEIPVVNPNRLRDGLSKDLISGFLVTVEKLVAIGSNIALYSVDAAVEAFKDYVNKLAILIGGSLDTNSHSSAQNHVERALDARDIGDWFYSKYHNSSQNLADAFAQRGKDSGGQLIEISPQYGRSDFVNYYSNGINTSLFGFGADLASIQNTFDPQAPVIGLYRWTDKASDNGLEGVAAGTQYLSPFSDDRTKPYVTSFYNSLQQKIKQENKKVTYIGHSAGNVFMSHLFRDIDYDHNQWFSWQDQSWRELRKSVGILSLADPGTASHNNPQGDYKLGEGQDAQWIKYGRDDDTVFTQSNAFAVGSGGNHDLIGWYLPSKRNDYNHKGTVYQNTVQAYQALRNNLT